MTPSRLTLRLCLRTRRRLCFSTFRRRRRRLSYGPGTPSRASASRRIPCGDATSTCGTTPIKRLRGPRAPRGPRGADLPHGRMFAAFVRLRSPRDERLVGDPGQEHGRAAARELLRLGGGRRARQRRGRHDDGERDGLEGVRVGDHRLRRCSDGNVGVLRERRRGKRRRARHR